MKVITGILLLIFSSLFMPATKKTNVSPGKEQDQMPLFSFGIIADVQYCDCETSGSRYYRYSLSKLREAVTAFKEDGTDFIFNLGDLIDRDINSYKPVTRILDSSGIKVYHVTGNHDYSVESRFKKRIPPLEGNKEGYYSFVHNNFRFIILNGNEISTYAGTGKKEIREASELIGRLREEGMENAVDWNGGMSSKQLAWLDQQLVMASARNEPVFILCHFPVWPEGVHNLLNSDDVLEILNRYGNIVAWFNGHNHMGNYGNFNMIHFVNFKGMVETETTNSFAVVEVYRNKIWIRGNGREKSQILAY